MPDSSPRTRYVAPTTTGARFAVYERLDDGSSRRVRGNYPTHARAEREIPRIEESRRQQRRFLDALEHGPTAND